MNLKDITVKNAKAMISGYTNLALDRFKLLDQETKEEAARRSAICSECFDAGKCVECGCDFNAMAVNNIKDCPRGKWLVDESKRTNINGTNDGSAAVQVIEYTKEQVHKDIGDINYLEVKEYKYDIVLTNNTDKRIALEYIELSCPCTKIVIDKNIIEPEDEYIVSITIDLTQLEDGFNYKYNSIKFYDLLEFHISYTIVVMNKLTLGDIKL